MFSESQMDRGNCVTCGQDVVLGWFGSDEMFRCGSCWDRVSDDKELPPVMEPRGQLMTDTTCLDQSTLVDVPAALLTHSLVAIGSDVVVTVSDPDNLFFKGFGAQGMWPAAYVLAEYLASKQMVGCSVLELGAGIGVPGIFCAKRGAMVTLTDVPWLLPVSKLNVDVNFDTADPQRPRIESLRWGSQDVKRCGIPQRLDMVIGSDIVYRENDFGKLLDTLSRLGARETLIAASCREQAHLLFISAAEASGWHCENLVQEDSTRNVQILRLHAPSKLVGLEVSTRPKPNFSTYGPLRQRSRLLHEPFPKFLKCPA